MPQDAVGSGRVVAPTAATVIAQIAASALRKGGSGRFRLIVNASVSGAAAADAGNMKLVINGADLANPIPSGLSGNNVKSEYDEILDGTNPVQVVAVGNGTAAIEYQATIEAEAIG